MGAMHGRVLFASQAWSDHDGEVFAALGDGTFWARTTRGSAGYAYEVAILMSTDTDLKPALEFARDLEGDPDPRCEVAAWSSADGYSRRLSIPGRQIWCHWLDESDYRSIADPTNYAEPIE